MVYLDIEIKHAFPFINICKVPREMLKTEGEVFKISWGTLQMLMNDKIMFDRYYCINSKKTPKNENMLAHFILRAYHHFLTATRFL